MLSRIQIHRTPNTITTATVVMLVIISVAILLQLHVMPIILSIPLFLIPLAIYATIIGLKSKHEPHKTQDHSYYFTWGGIMLAVGVGWIILYEGIGVILGIIAVFSIALGYVYLNKTKSSMINFN